MTITITTEPGRYVISAPHDAKDSDPQLAEAVTDAKAMGKIFGFEVEVVREPRPKRARKTNA